MIETPRSCFGPSASSNNGGSRWNPFSTISVTGSSPKAIRPFVLGRKNRLLSGNPRGADTTYASYLVIEAATARSLNPFAYFHLRGREGLRTRNEKDWEDFLPENLHAEEVNTRFVAAVRRLRRRKDLPVFTRLR